MLLLKKILETEYIFTKLLLNFVLSKNKKIFPEKLIQIQNTGWNYIFYANHLTRKAKRNVLNSWWLINLKLLACTASLIP